MPLRLVLACLTLMGVLIACGGRDEGVPVAAPAQAVAPADSLIVALERSLVRVDPDSGHATLSVPGGAADATWSEVFITSRRGGRSYVDAIDLQDGSTRSLAGVPRGFEVAVVAPGGEAIALARPDAHGTTDPYDAQARRRTRLVVVRPDHRREVKTFDLEGNYEPEAFSVDGRWLFLIEYMPALDPNRYSVNQLNLSSGKLGRVGGKTKVAAPGVMRGTGRMQALGPDHDVLYTLYTKQPPNDVHRHLSKRQLRSGNVHAFVHTLSLSGIWAHCIDLPMPFGTGLATAHGMAVSPEGDRLYVADPSHHRVAVADLSKLRVVDERKVHLGRPRAGGLPMAVGGGAVFAAGDKEIVVLDALTLKEVGRWATDSPIRSLAVGEGSGRLYVGLEDALEARDAGTGEVISSVPFAGLEKIAQVEPAG